MPSQDSSVDPVFYNMMKPMKGKLSYKLIACRSFFSRTRRRAAYLYIKKEKRGNKNPKNLQGLQHALHSPEEEKEKRPTDPLYTPAVPTSWRMERPFNPAIDHSWTSSLVTRRAACTLGATPLKTQEFLCFQITHTSRMTIELKPLRRRSCT